VERTSASHSSESPTIREAMIALEIRGLGRNSLGPGLLTTTPAAPNSADLTSERFE